MPCGMTKSTFRRYHNEQEHQIFNVVSKNRHDLLFILSNLAKFSLQIKTPVVLSKAVMHFCEIKRVLEKCLVCQRQPVGPCSQKMAPLPPERVSLSPAFTHVGIDFAGPLLIIMRKWLLSEGLHLYLHFCLFPQDPPRAYQWLVNQWILSGVYSYDQ